MYFAGKSGKLCDNTVMSAKLTEQEQSDFQNMIIACGRNPSEFGINIDESSGKVIVKNTISSKEKEYNRDDQPSWIINFATDLKMGEI